MKIRFLNLLLLALPAPAYAAVDPGPIWFRVLYYALPVVIVVVLITFSFWVKGWRKLLWALALYLFIGIGLSIYLTGFKFLHDFSSLIEFIFTWPFFIFTKII